MLRVSKDGKRKLVSLGVPVSASYPAFTKNQPKRSGLNRDAILHLITKTPKQYQEQLREFKAENKEFTAQVDWNGKRRIQFWSVQGCG